VVSIRNGRYSRNRPSIRGRPDPPRNAGGCRGIGDPRRRAFEHFPARCGTGNGPTRMGLPRRCQTVFLIFELMGLENFIDWSKLPRRA
jgi:hypothetical protein